MNAITHKLSEVKGVTFTREKLTDLRDEGEKMFLEHWREANVDASLPLDPDWALYERMEELDMEVCVVARADGRLVGYAVYLIVPTLHYRHKAGVADVFYIEPAYRKGWVGIELFRVVERLLRERGVPVMETRVKTHLNVGTVMRYLGMSCTEHLYRKALR